MTPSTAVFQQFTMISRECRDGGTIDSGTSGTRGFAFGGTTGTRGCFLRAVDYDGLYIASLYLAQGLKNMLRTPPRAFEEQRRLWFCG